MNIDQESNFNSKEQDTNVYKFKVNMIVSLFAETELEAFTQLDAQGGFVIARNVELLGVTNIHETEE